jgi:hypothetical protein
MSTTRDYTETVRLLLVKAEGAATPEEAETYHAMAARLITKHGIDRALLAAGVTADDPLETRLIPIDSAYNLQRTLLLDQIARAMHCNVVRSTGHSGAFLAGRRSDLDDVMFLYSSLLVQALRRAAALRSRQGASQTRSLRGAWLQGFAARIGERMRAATAEATAEAAPGAALVLVDRAQVAKRAMNEHLAGLGGRTRSSSVRTTNRAAYQAGRAAADSADLGQQRIAGTRRAINA